MEIHQLTLVKNHYWWYGNVCIPHSINVYSIVKILFWCWLNVTLEFGIISSKYQTTVQSSFVIWFYIFLAHACMWNCETYCYTITEYGVTYIECYYATHFCFLPHLSSVPLILIMLYLKWPMPTTSVTCDYRVL